MTPSNLPGPTNFPGSKNLPQEDLAGDVAKALSRLGNFRVLKIQELCYQHKYVIPASVLMSLGFHETGLVNKCGGAVMDKGVWVQSYTDHGYLQLSELYHSAFLKSQEGCPDGTWVPDGSGHTALAAHYNPRFTPVTQYVLNTMIDDRITALSAGVKLSVVTRVVVAAHNCGMGNALDAYRAGDIDKFTAHHNYSAKVMEAAPYFHNWVAAHPNWQYKG